MKKLFNYLSVVALLLLCACGGATYITPDNMSVNFPIEGGEENISVDADGSWEIASCPEWIKTEKLDDGLAIKVERNGTGKILEGDILLKGKEGVEVTISVTQATKCTHITASEESVELEKEGGTKTINIDTDGLPQVEAPEGFTASYANGVLTVTAGANDGGKRSGDIKLTADEQSATIAVSQKGNICPRCNGTGKVKCSRCGGRGTIIDGGGGDSGWHACTNCGGKGHVERYTEYDDYLGYPVSEIYKSPGYREGSGKMTCPECGGSGS